MKEKHFCRCCLSEDCYKDMTNDYYIGNKTENYFKMLMDIFNIKISNKDPYRCFICETCVSKLRDAAAFKDQVLNTQKTIFKNHSWLPVESDTSIVPNVEYNVYDNFDDHLSDHFNASDFVWDDNDSPLKGHTFIIKVKEKQDKVENVTKTAQKPVSPKRKSKEPEIQKDEIINTRLIGIKTYSRAKNKCSVSTKRSFSPENTSAINTKRCSSPESASAVDRVIDADDTMSSSKTKNNPAKRTVAAINREKGKLSNKKKAEIPETQLHLIHKRENTFKLIQNSNILLFRPLKNKFGCNLCRSDFLDLKQLREHTFSHSNIKRMALKIKNLRGLSYRNADISDLKCNICSEKCNDLTDLRNHLKNKHSILFHGADHYLIPYNIQNGFQCVLCDSKFNSYLRLSIHMNIHYSNHVCEICGHSFINRLSLRGHVNSMHKQKNCTLCPAVFLNHSSKIKHLRIAHKINNSRRHCLLCKKSFRYTYLLQEHKIQEHGFKRQISSCPECGKTFGSSTNLKIHIRSVHIKERNHPCNVCGMRFFTKCDQKRHERTHMDVRSFSCSYCEAKFKSKDSWRRHLKRQHGHVFGDIK